MERLLPLDAERLLPPAARAFEYHYWGDTITLASPNASRDDFARFAAVLG